MFDWISFDSGFETLIFSPHNNPTLIISIILPMRNSLEWNDETICSDNFMHFTWITPVGNYLSLNGEKQNILLYKFILPLL